MTKETKKQTIEAAIAIIKAGTHRRLDQASHILHGLPVGGWGETRMGMFDLLTLLPAPHLREYTVEQFVDAVYDVINARYSRRDI